MPGPVPHPRDDDSNGQSQNDQPPVEISPIVLGRPGRPSFSLEALRERVQRQFQDETASRDDILRDLDTADKRRDLLAEVLDYVLAVEAVTLGTRDKRTILDRAYVYLFSFGPLDPYLRDNTITEITVSSPQTIHIRHGMAPLTPVQAAFDDRAHLEDTLERLLTAGGVALGSPFVESGVILEGRRARISLIAPPISPEYSLTIRLHPRPPLTLDDLQARLEAVTPQAAALLQSVLAAGRGVLIVGDSGTGKTTLTSALAAVLPTGSRVEAVERAAEMSLPDTVQRRGPSDAGGSFAAALQQSLGQNPDWLIADEIRGDEAAAVHMALMRDAAPRYLWVFRGDSQPERLRNALSMVVRQHDPTMEQAAINRAILRHLPVVAALRRLDGRLRLHLVAEWIAQDDKLTLRALLTDSAG